MKAIVIQAVQSDMIVTKPSWYLGITNRIIKIVGTESIKASIPVVRCSQLNMKRKRLSGWQRNNAIHAWMSAQQTMIPPNIEWAKKRPPSVSRSTHRPLACAKIRKKPSNVPITASMRLKRWTWNQISSPSSCFILFRRIERPYRANKIPVEAKTIQENTMTVPCARDNV